MANTTLWSPTLGDVTLPIAPPPTSGGAGSLDNTALGASVPAAVTTNALHVDTGTKTATAVAGAATLNKMSGVVTSEALTTAAGADYTLTLTNSDIAAADIVIASVDLGAGTGGIPTIASVKTGAGQVVVVVQNIHATAAFNAAIRIGFVVFKN